MTARAPSRLARNALVNTAGLALETVGVVLLIPYLVRHLGLSAYGLVTAVIAITLIVQSIGQAVVATVIQQIAALRERSTGLCDVWDEIRAVRRPLGVLAGFGLLGAVVVTVLRTRILGLVLAEGSLASEAVQSLRTIAFALPLLSRTNLFPAILRGRQDFVRANSVKVVLLRCVFWARSWSSRRSAHGSSTMCGYASARSFWREWPPLPCWRAVAVDPAGHGGGGRRGLSMGPRDNSA